MTTVVVTPEQIAHDARASNGVGVIMSDQVGKSMCWNGDIYVGVGNASVFLSIMYAMIHGKFHPRWKIDSSATIIVSRHDGTVESLTAKVSPEGKVTLECNPIVVTPIAVGSGGQWATAAMDHGKDALEAIEYAMERDSCSGGTITVIDRYRKEKMADYNLEWVTGANMQTLLAITGEEHHGTSMEDFYTNDTFVQNTLFKLTPLTLEFRHHPSKIAASIAQQSASILRPFEFLKSRWGFQVDGDVMNLNRYANRLPYTDWLNHEFYKPAGLQVRLVDYITALKATVKKYSSVEKDLLEPMTKYVNHCIGDPNQLLRMDNRILDIDIQPEEYRTRLDGKIDREDTTNRCRVDELVTNNKQWVDVQDGYTSLVKAFKDLKANNILEDSERLSRAVIELSGEIQRLGDVDSIVGSSNFKSLVTQIERLAFIVDGVGVLGYLIQQLETALRHNADLMQSVE